MSSISRARSPASASVEAGPPTTSGARDRAFSPMPRPAAPASAGARGRRARGGMSSGAAPPNCSEPSANASSSSSISPSATMRGSIAASVFNSSRKISRAMPPGAPGRQIERRLRQRSGICARLESIDQPAIDQRGDDGAQERHGDGNAENAHGLPDSGSGANIGSDFDWSWARDANACSDVPTA